MKTTQREIILWIFNIGVVWSYVYKDSMCTWHDFMCMFSVTENDVESTVQDAETKGNPANLTAFSNWRFF